MIVHVLLCIRVCCTCLCIVSTRSHQCFEGPHPPCPLKRGFFFLSRSNALPSPRLSSSSVSGSRALPFAACDHHASTTTTPHARVRVRRTSGSHCPTQGEGSSADRGTRPRLRLLHTCVRVRRPTVVHCPTEGEGLSAYRGTLPRLLLQRAFVRARRPTVVHGPTTSEGMSAHRGTLPRSRLRHACVRVRRPTVVHCPARGEGTSAHRGTLPRLHYWDVDALGLLRSLFSSCLRPRTPGPRSGARGAPASWASRWRGSLGGCSGNGGGGGGAEPAFFQSLVGSYVRESAK